jgi:beta-glucosidase
VRISRALESASANFYFQYDEAVDMTDLESIGGVLAMELRLHTPPSAPVLLRMDCGWPCSGAVDLTPVLKTMDSGEWQTISVPVACFARRGVDLSQVNTPFPHRDPRCPVGGYR